MIVWVVELVRQVQIATGNGHFLGKGSDKILQRFTLQVAEDVLPVTDRGNIARGVVIKGMKDIFLFLREDGVDHLVQIEIRKENGRAHVLRIEPPIGVVEQHAVFGHIDF